MIATLVGIAGAVLVVLALSVPLEALAARPADRRVTVKSLPWRALICTGLVLFWLGVYGRLYLAGFSALTSVAFMVAISLRKRQLVAEPLVFSDSALLRLIVRHPDLYYLGFMRDVRFAAGALALVAGLLTWIWLEPPLLGAAARWSLALGILALGGLIWAGANKPPLARLIRERSLGPDLERHVGRYGLLVTFVGYALLWRAGEAAVVHEPARSLATVHGHDLIVILQLESFIDPVAHGLSTEPLPGLERARALAFAHGSLLVPSHGAFTMRTEYAVLTGHGPAESRFRQFDPYLSARGPTPDTVASRMRARGWRTLFIHPFRAGFFDRDIVVPRLGFDEASWEDDFADARRVGPYVADEAVADRVLAEAGTGGGRPTLIAAVTMENHGPWAEGRLPDEADPTRVYLRHLANSDRALARLVDVLSRRTGRALLCAYGDHPPILPDIDLARPPETAYVLVELGRDVPPPPPRAAAPLTADALGRLLARSALGHAVDASASPLSAVRNRSNRRSPPS